MFDEEDTNNPISVIHLIVALMIGMVVVCSIVIPLVIESSSDPMKNDNGEGMGLPLAKSVGAELSAELEIVADSSGVHINGDYIEDREYLNQIILLSDKVALYIQDGQLWYFDSTDNSNVAITQLDVTISDGKVNDVDYDWLYYPNIEGKYRAYTPPLEYRLGDVVAFGVYEEGGIISNNDTITANTSPLEFTVEIKDKGYGVGQVYYTWTD